MSFVQKSVEEINAMSDDEFKAYKDAELKHNEEVVDGLKAKIEALETKGADSTEEMAKLVDIVKEHGVALNKVVKRGSAEAKEVEKSLPEVLKENAQDIKAIAKGVSAKEVVVKADTLRSSITDNTESYRLPEIERLAHRKLVMALKSLIFCIDAYQILKPLAAKQNILKSILPIAATNAT